MKTTVLCLTSLFILAFEANAQEREDNSRTYSADSTAHYFLRMQKNLPDVMISNPFSEVDITALKNHPMVTDPLQIVDFPEYKRLEEVTPPSGFQKFDFQKPGRFKNELNFNPKFRQ